MNWTRIPLFGVFLLVGILGVSLLFATAAGAAEADDDAKPETTVGAGDGSTPEAEKQDKKEEEKALTPVEKLEKKTAYTINTLIMFVCGVLVLFMQAGFAMLEVGLNSAKNTVNILFKNVMDLSVGVVLFLLIGYGLMYGGNPEKNKYFGYSHPLMTLNDGGAEVSSLPDYSASADFLFQVAFAATAATIVSGAVAGRMRFGAYLIYSAVLTGLIYPISGYWKWGGGFLDMLGFQDFAGSVVVHAVGGFAGLAGAIVLGARLGRFTKDGKSVPMPGHNIAFAALGVFILWIGWYGFNPGSQLTYFGGADATATTDIALTTTIAAACGAIAAMVVAWILFKKPDVTMALNGALAGLVGITANCDRVSQGGAIAIGVVAGVLVVAGILLLDKLRIDDPVGAWPVHGLCGVWGGIATGIFGTIPLDDAGNAIFASRGAFIWAQCYSTAIICVWAFATMFVLFWVLKACGILRVAPEDEQVGLDVSEHGMHAYPPGMLTDYHPSAPASSPAPAKV